MSTKNYSLDYLLDIFSLMRGQKGCAWTKNQTWDSLTRYIIEEAYEVVDAVESKKYLSVKEELADLLNQIIFYSQIATENNFFSFQDVINTLVEKTIRRHPNVFGDHTIKNDLDSLKKSWAILKRKERKANKVDELNTIPWKLPALSFASILQDRLDGIGLELNDLKNTIHDIKVLLINIDKSSFDDIKLSERYLGLIIFNCANLARIFSLDAEKILRKTNRDVINKNKNINF